MIFKNHSIAGIFHSPPAEGEGFKPPIPGKGIPDFESSAFGHSANLPIFQMKMIDIYFSSLSKSNAKVII